MLVFDAITARMMKVAVVAALMALPAGIGARADDEADAADVPGISVASPEDAAMPLPADIVDTLIDGHDKAAEESADQQ